MLLRKEQFVLLFLVPLLNLLSGGCCHNSRRELIVSAAMSLRDCFEEIGRFFEKDHKGVKVLFNFGPAGALRMQIEAGASTDVFASAGKKDMDLLAKRGLILESTRHEFAENVAVLIAPISSPIKSFMDLKKQTIKRFSMTNPQISPIGQYAMETLVKQGIWDELKGKIVYADNVKQVIDYVARKEVDAGIVFKTDAILRSKEVKIVAEAPPKTYTRPLYSIAVLKNAEEPQLGKEFISIVLSTRGQELLKKYGFKVFNLGK